MLKLIVSLFEVFGDQSSCEFIDLGSMECENKSVSRSEMSGNPSGLDCVCLCVSQHFVITSFPNTVKRFEVNVSLLFFFYTFGMYLVC